MRNDKTEKNGKSSILIEFYQLARRFSFLNKQNGIISQIDLNILFTHEYYITKYIVYK